MKVIAINGSPKPKGNTYHSLKLVCDELANEGIKAEIVQIGNKPVRGCTACSMCIKNQDERCVLPDDGVNDVLQKVKEADGLLLGSPVHYAGVGGSMKSFLDRLFYVAGVNGSLFRHKVGGAVAAVRRSGGIPTYNQLNIFFGISEMIIAGSNYWNVIHGAAPGEVEQDGEGVQIMKVLGKNMAYCLKLIEHAKGSVDAPEQVRKEFTNFIR